MPIAHTPGPWTAAEHFDGDESLGISVGAGRQEIVRIHDIGREGFANAALIAAAPDLLAALREIEALDDSVVGLDRIEYARNVARSAIAKATQV